MGAHFKALLEGVLMAPLDSRYTQVGFNYISVQLCDWFRSGAGRLSLQSDDMGGANLLNFRKAIGKLFFRHGFFIQKHLGTLDLD